MGASAQSLTLRKVKPEVIESRLRDCLRKNIERREKLEELFRQAGCDAGQLSEQQVKGTKEPNVICSLPGESESTILIGAHFDNDGSGRGVIDNWSGAVQWKEYYDSYQLIAALLVYLDAKLD